MAFSRTLPTATGMQIDISGEIGLEKKNHERRLTGNHFIFVTKLQCICYETPVHLRVLVLNIEVFQIKFFLKIKSLKKKKKNFYV